MFTLLISFFLIFAIAPNLVGMEKSSTKKQPIQKTIFHNNPLLIQSTAIHTDTIRCADSFIKQHFLDKLVDFSETDPKNIFKPMDAFVGINLKNRKDYSPTAQILKGLAKTLLPMFQHVLLSEEACAQSFFTYLNQHPELTKFHADYVQTLRNCALNHYTGEIAYAITHALFFAAEDWIASHIKKLKAEANSKWVYSKQRTNKMRPLLQKQCPGKLDACYDILSKTAGVSVTDWMQPSLSAHV